LCLEVSRKLKKIVTFLVKDVYLLIPRLLFKALKKGFSALGEFANKIFSFFRESAIGWIADPIIEAFNTIKKPITELFAFILDKIDTYLLSPVNDFFEWLQKALSKAGVDFKLPRLEKPKTPSIAETTANATSSGSAPTTSLTQNNTIQVSAPQGVEPGRTGLTPEGAAAAMKEAAHGVFTLELKRIVESTY